MPQNLSLQTSIARALQYYLGDYYFYTGPRRKLDIGMIGKLEKRVFSEEEHIKDIEGLDINIEPVRSTLKIHEPFNFIAYSADTNKTYKLQVDDTLNVNLGSKRNIDLILYYTNPSVLTFNFNKYAADIAEALPERLSSKFYDFVIVDTLLNVDKLGILQKEMLEISDNGSLDLSKIIKDIKISGEIEFSDSISGASSIFADDVTLAVDLIRYDGVSFGASKPFFEKI